MILLGKQENCNTFDFENKLEKRKQKIHTGMFMRRNQKTIVEMREE